MISWLFPNSARGAGSGSWWLYQIYCMGKMPGEPLTEEYFWSLDPLVREDIRVKFCVAFESVLHKPKSMAGRQIKLLMQLTERCCIAV